MAALKEVNFLDDIERVRTILRDEPLKPPMLVVVGDQSTGKTSTLERLAGVELPRGEGIVTRCPLALSMRRVAKKGEQYAEVSVPSRSEIETRRTGLSEIDTTVREYQNLVAGDTKGISKTEISLTVAKVGVQDLTLIDLPGLVQLAVGGLAETAPADIRDMIRKYICAPEAVILCIVHAGLDPETSEALKLAREFDPAGERTAVVFTKADECTSGLGMRIKKIRSGESVNVGLGLVMIRNRTQTELDAKKSAAEIDKLEREFFEKHPDADILKGCSGVDALSSLLVRVQSERIAKILPKFRERVMERLREQRRNLEKLPCSVSGDPAAATAEFMRLVTGFGRTVEALLAGDLEADFDADQDENPEDFYLAARLFERFEKMTQDFCRCKPDFFSKEYAGLVETALRNSRGASLPNFISMPAFRKLFNKELDKFKDPAESCLEDVKKRLENTLLKIAASKFQNYQVLLVQVTGLLQKMMDDYEEKAKVDIVQFTRQEAFPFTLNTYYEVSLENIKAQIVAEKDKLHQLALQNKRARDDSQESKLNPKDLWADITKYAADAIQAFFAVKEPDGEELKVDNEALKQRADVLQMQASLASYWKIVYKRFCDFIPMRIRVRIRFVAMAWTFQINLEPRAVLKICLCVPLQKELVPLLMALKEPDGSLDVLMEEPVEVRRHREELERSIKRLAEAQEILAKTTAKRSPS